MFTADAANGFEDFWSGYPKKHGKLDAQKAWAKLKPDEALRADIFAAVKRARDSEQWRKDGGKFIPLPATYLNGRRWEDEGVRTVTPPAWNEV